jgi:hypothetical protein
MSKIPKVKFKTISEKESVKIIKEVINLVKDNNEDEVPLKKSLIEVSEKLENIYNEKDTKTRDIKIKKIIGEEYSKDINEIKKSELKFQKEWDKYNDEFMKNLSLYLNIDWDINKITGNLWIMPVCPYDFNEKSFYLYWWMKKEEMITSVSHECCHFLFLEKCKKILGNNADEKIILKLNEIVVDPILNNKLVNKSFGNLKIEHKAYDIFYKKENIYILEEIRSFFKKNNIDIAITKSYEYLKKEI